VILAEVQRARGENGKACRDEEAEVQGKIDIFLCGLCASARNTLTSINLKPRISGAAV
jgi:hypothetical protein